MAGKRIIAIVIILVLFVLVTTTVLVAAGTGQPPTANKEPAIAKVTGVKKGEVLRGTTLAPNVGETLYATNGTWTNNPTSFTYQWSDCNTSGASCSPIPGATNSSYVIANSDRGNTIVVTVTASNSNGSASQTSTPTGVVQGSTVVTSCFSSPGSCGFPDPNFNWPNTAATWATGGGGVGPNNGTSPIACSALTPSGSISTTSNGQTIQNINIVNGSILVQNSGVTINNVCITSGGGVGGHSIDLTAAGTNLTVKNSTLSGLDAGNATCLDSACRSVESPISNVNGAAGLVMSHDYLFWCGECVHSSGTITDSYIISNGQMSSAQFGVDHYEDTYTCGGGITANHDVMYNPQGQTGDMFMDTNVCGSNIHFTATNNLFAGGGWELYPVDTPGETTAVVVITGNRFSRCTTSSIFNQGSGGTVCSGGADSNGYFPLGGFFNLIYQCPSVGMTYSNNVWDNDNSNAPC